MHLAVPRLQVSWPEWVEVQPLAQPLALREVLRAYLRALLSDSVWAPQSAAYMASCIAAGRVGTRLPLPTFQGQSPVSENGVAP